MVYIRYNNFADITTDFLKDNKGTIISQILNVQEWAKMCLKCENFHKYEIMLNKKEATQFKKELTLSVYDVIVEEYNINNNDELAIRVAEIEELNI